MMKKWMVVVALVFASLPVLVLAQQVVTTAPPAGPEGKMDKEWQAKHEKMVAEMNAMDTRLDEKLAAMNAAKGDQKIEAMAAVINELVSQRKAMEESFNPMHHGMKCPRMGQQAGMPQDCPMMKHHGGMQADVPKKEGTQ
jgi:hypothetical protein